MTSPHLPAPACTAGHSRYVQRIRRRYAEQLPGLAPGAPRRDAMAQTLATLQAQGLDTGSALRVLRQLVMERLATLDCEQGAPLEVVTLGMTELGELALDVACTQAQQELEARHGQPLGDQTGQPAQLWIVGMGKFGARELNVSSDIDLIYLYDDEGQTTGTADGRGRISNQEFFSRVVKRIYQLIGDVTEHGFVFRVDLALRPNGNSGPSVCSLDSLEHYLLQHGREWERFAWLKSRVVAPRSSVTSGSAQALRGVVLPFVFRRYLDYAVFESLRDLHRQIRDQANRRSAARPERANDVKLGRGGIREIEFTVQLLQVVRGGHFPELRTRPTLAALQRVAKAGLMPQDTANQLAQAYDFLRRVEHRIQYLDDQQTHALPTRDDDLAWIAGTLGFADTAGFLRALDAHRDVVAHEFGTLLGQADVPEPEDGASLDTLIEDMPASLQAQLQQWEDSPRVQSLSDEGRRRLHQLMQRSLQWLSDGDTDEAAVLRMMNWLEPLLRRESYLALLLERPAVHERLLRLLGAAKWPARYLIQHPGVIDELASPNLLHERFSGAQFERDVEARRTSLAITGEDDDETLLNLLRRAQHAEQFRTLTRDVEGLLSVEQVADDLSALADAVLRITSRWCWQRFAKRHRELPQFGIVGYGKLGGKELGYGSDLDIVFVYDDDAPEAPEVYAAYVRRLINWLTVKTAEGDLYEIDTALRPNGNSGLLVTSFDAFALYQTQRGSNTAWTWEHQAMTRARWVLDGWQLGFGEADDTPHPLSTERFEAVRRAVITAPRDLDALQREILDMRERVRSAHPVRGGQFDFKHSPGGMVDVEFAVQYLVLAHSAVHPELQPNLGNIHLLRLAEQAGLLPPGVGQQSGDAYRNLRRLQHKARLDETSTAVEASRVAREHAAVLVLWQAVFGTNDLARA
ncbi:bifunctional glutamine synthetase adenylyltransferase/deadenyltransferase [Comamonas serinivorans]|uniref:Bifunctional glutamine synthetase adenylyltransferase/adenylyl-removing enzyme n=1 Tax=Comamonas serinivorans TaxID=1082851 RepID=A0A1Y0EJB6_9BURK|nr:bifunctional [glutamate--ammonia ligase]-adenylyl-L-tyrosine phosphorylase/[glutamate--ammonia-ligase] adenylyltransferase [Comamonas serinivorans]ARU03725.1 bifunctional glutamine synthetase adenylyltransferase/deadenyltransferase [Comamonas serinivorans]